MPHRVAAIDSMLRPLHLERLFLGRHKFHHFRIWYRDQLSAYLKSVLLDRRSVNRSYLNGSELSRMVSDHVRGKRNFTQMFHRILTIELLQRQLLD
jgi:asparagine synthase (glutamine-hydrolysing)